MDEQIGSAFFLKYGDVMASMMMHYKRYHAVPGLEEVKEVFPDFEPIDSDQPIEYFIDALKQRRKKNLLNEALVKSMPLIKDKKIDEAEKLIRGILSTIKTEIKTSSDLDIRDNTEARFLEYQGLKINAGVDGFTTGWPGLDDLTLGYHPGDLIVYIAEPKKGKTWYLVWQAHHIWSVERVPVLFLTREMRPKAIHKRFDAIASKVPYSAFRRGMLTKDEEERYKGYLKKVEDKENNPPFVVMGYSMEEKSATVSSLIPKVEKHLMDGGALFVDGLYLMEDDQGETDWKGLVNIGRDLKNLGQNYNIPVIASTQAKIEGKGYIPQMENIAYARYLAQYVDALLSIAMDKKDKISRLANIFLLAQREGDIGNFPINFQFEPYIDFSQRACVTRTPEEDNDGVQRELGL
jgi:replicative DNA helicase